MINRSKYFRVSITDKCNLSCHFCHKEGQNQRVITTLTPADFSYICGIAKAHGFSKFKLTGGEPTLRSDIGEIIREINNLNVDDLSIITNGTLLLEKSKDLIDSGLKRLNVTLNTLDPEKYKKIYGGKSLDQVIQGIDQAISMGLTNMKINFVYLGTESNQDLMDLIEFVRLRSLILVVLPIISPTNPEPMTSKLDMLYSKFKSVGIEKEYTFTDKEGIKKRDIRLTNKAHIILRKDELSRHNPYSFCRECESKHHCSEGIFPIRLSSDGVLIPCLANSSHNINIREAIVNRENASIHEAFDQIIAFQQV